VKTKIPNQIIVCGIGTGVGKTLVSSLLVNALAADYWKPIQTGPVEETDAHFVAQWVDKNATTIFQEKYHFSTPASPHIAAKLEGKYIELSTITLPFSANRMVIECAGGILVPLNDRATNLDLVKQFKLPVILVANEYLGSINHTLMSIEILRQHHCSVLGVIYSGFAYLDNADIIAKHTQLPILGRVDEMSEISAVNMAAATEKLRLSLSNFFDLS